jgi:hypothetical protein
MKLLLVGLLAVLLAGCGDNGRYQIAAASTGAYVYRLDTKNGELSLCGIGVGLATGDARMNCVTGFK